MKYTVVIGLSVNLIFSAVLIAMFCACIDLCSGKTKQEHCTDDFDADFETVFEATFGNRWYTWSFRNWKKSYSQYSRNEFEWRNRSEWTSNESRERKNASDIDSDEETCAISSSSERKILDLPPEGPLKIEDVKKA